MTLKRKKTVDTATRLLMLLDVINHGSFAKAADIRGIDRSVVSKQISKLEEDLNLRLLNRTTRSICPTEAGSAMAKKAEEIRVLLQDTLTLAEEFNSEVHGTLKIAAAPLMGRRYLQPVINDFQKRFPDVEVELHMESRVADIVSEGIDLAFRFGEPKDSTLIAKRVARNRMIIAASPAFIERYGKPQKMEDLANLPAATFSSNPIRGHILRYFNEKDEPCEQKIRSFYRANDGETLLNATLEGTVFFAAPSFIIDNQISSGDLVPLLTDVKLAEHSGLYVIYPHRDLPSRVRIFLEATFDYIGREQPIWERKIPGFNSMYTDD